MDSVPKADAPAAGPSADAAAKPAGLDAALARGIQPPSFDDGTFRVDPFVAVILFERYAAAPADAPFERVEASGPAPAGYRVTHAQEGDLLWALGLREGDVVEKLNAVAATGPEQIELALDAAENRLTVTLFREDLSFTNSYRFEGGLAWRDVIAGDGVPDEGTGEPTPPEGTPEVTPATETEPPAARSKPPARRGASSRKPKSSGRGSATPARPVAPTSTDIRCASASACTITKRAFDNLRASPSKLQSGVNIVPAIRNDVFSGYKLKSVSSGSPVHKLGFRAGDKITHVNGRDLTDDAQAMALYWSLGSSKLFKVRYQRGGRNLVKSIRVV